MTLKEQLQAEIKNKIKEQIALKQQSLIKPQPATVGGFISGIGKDISTMGMGMLGLGLETVIHPIESIKTTAATAGEFVKILPKAGISLAKQMGKTIVSPIKTAKKAVAAYKAVRAIPYEEQKKQFKEISEKISLKISQARYKISRFFL